MIETGEKQEKIIGKVYLKDGEYLLEIPPAYRQRVQGERDKLFLGKEDNKDLKGLEKAEVEVLLSEPKSFVVGLVALKARDSSAINKIILCYYVGDDVLRDFTVDKALIKQKTEYLVKRGIISPEVQKILSGK